MVEAEKLALRGIHEQVAHTDGFNWETDCTCGEKFGCDDDGARLHWYQHKVEMLEAQIDRHKAAAARTPSPMQLWVLRRRGDDFREVAQWLVDVASESEGIAGWHLNGVVLDWADVSTIDKAQRLIEGDKAYE